jgi:hypothetical protein
VLEQAGPVAFGRHDHERILAVEAAGAPAGDLLRATVEAVAGIDAASLVDVDDDRHVDERSRRYERTEGDRADERGAAGERYQ